jgi:hypothetical protein
MPEELDRKATWRRIDQEVARFDDGTGKKVDAGIHRLVVALRAHGCPTFASCEGHFSWGRAQPWVEIRLPGAGPRCQEDDESWAVLLPKERAVRLALVRLVDAFYANRADVPHHARLVVHGIDSPGWLHVSTVTLDAASLLKGNERRTWLQQGLREAQAFASFLKEKFLERGPIVGLEPVFAATRRRP